MSQRVQAVNSFVSLVCWSEFVDNEDPMNGGTIRRVIRWRIDKMIGIGTIRRIVRVNGTTMKFLFGVWRCRIQV